MIDLRAFLARGEFFAAPGIHDMITATIARELGFPVIYASGFWLTASALGLPDAGLASYTQMLDRVATLKQSVGPDTAVIADADTGYGGLLNVRHTVRGFEAAGASGIQIEDQEFPKRCGHTPGRRVIPREAMVTKIKVALEARLNASTVIIARTDARQAEGLEATLARGDAYAAAGADIVFVEALESEAEMREACRRIDRPMMANMADGGRTPIRSGPELTEIGYACAIYPAMAALAAAAASRAALLSLKQTGTSVNPAVPLHDFRHMCCLLGFEDVWEFERRWADAPQETTR